MLNKINKTVLFQDSFIRWGHWKGKSLIVRNITNAFYRNNGGINVGDFENDKNFLVNFLYPENYSTISFSDIVEYLFKYDYNDYIHSLKKLEKLSKDYRSIYRSNKTAINFNCLFFEINWFYLNSKIKLESISKFYKNNYQYDLLKGFTVKEIALIKKNISELISLFKYTDVHLLIYSTTIPYNKTIIKSYNQMTRKINSNLSYHSGFLSINLRNETFNFKSRCWKPINHLWFKEKLLESIHICDKIQRIKNRADGGLILFDSKNYNVDDDKEIDSMLMECWWHQAIFVDNLNSNNNKWLTVTN